MLDDDRVREATSRNTFFDPEAYRMSAVTASAVADWACGTLQVWLTGYSDYIEEAAEQFRIRYLGKGRYLVDTIDGCAAKTFKIAVFVTEER